jgi:hypothetical protein
MEGCAQAGAIHPFARIEELVELPLVSEIIKLFEIFAS